LETQHEGVKESVQEFFGKFTLALIRTKLEEDSGNEWAPPILTSGATHKASFALSASVKQETASMNDMPLAKVQQEPISDASDRPGRCARRRLVTKTAVPACIDACVMEPDGALWRAKPSRPAEGTEVLEGVGKGTKRPFSLHGDGAAVASQQNKIRINMQARKSGVSNCYWDAHDSTWRVKWQVDGRKHLKCFTRKQFTIAGKTVEQADSDALRAAVAFRNTLVQQGVIRKKPPERPSGATGVTWHRKGQHWRAKLVRCSNGQRKGKQAIFKPLDDTPNGIEKARLLAVAKRKEMEQSYHTVQISGQEKPEPVVHPVVPESNVPGVVWVGKKQVDRSLTSFPADA